MVVVIEIGQVVVENVEIGENTVHSMIDADAEATSERNAEAEGKKASHGELRSGLGNDAPKRVDDREAAFASDQRHEKARVRDVDDVQERVKLAHEVRRNGAYVQLVVAVERYEKQAACEVRERQVHDEERDCFFVSQTLFVHDEHEHVAYDAYDRGQCVLDYYDRFCAPICRRHFILLVYFLYDLFFLY